MPTPQRLVVIVTALPVEREAVIEHLRDVSDEPEVRGSIYRRGIFDEQSVPWDVVVAEIGAGNAAAAAGCNQGPDAGRRCRLDESLRLRVGKESA